MRLGTAPEVQTAETGMAGVLAETETATVTATVPEGRAEVGALAETTEGRPFPCSASCQSHLMDSSNGHRRGEGGGTNPGNNLHVSGLATRVDTRDLEAAFGKIGRVGSFLP